MRCIAARVPVYALEPQTTNLRSEFPYHYIEPNTSGREKWDTDKHSLPINGLSAGFERTQNGN
jgi:hypothetical protein